MGFSVRTMFTCIDAVQEASRHDHLEGRGSAAENHQYGARHGHQIVQEEAPFPAGRGEEWGEETGDGSPLQLSQCLDSKKQIICYNCFYTLWKSQPLPLWPRFDPETPSAPTCRVE